MTELAARAAELTWYHAIELAPGVVTPGYFDTRGAVSKVPLAQSLEGHRCLDVGTWDGFWAFEMERRGADEVVAIDIDDPSEWDWPARGRGEIPVLAAHKPSSATFELAREALGSSVERVNLNVYELSPERLGEFDTIFVGSLLLHLRDPVRALERVRSVCRGEAVIADAVDFFPSLTRPRTPVARLDGLHRPWWWTPNVAGSRRMAEAAGFEILDRTGMYFIPLGPGAAKTRWRALNPLTALGREHIVTKLVGIPHAAVRARPEELPGVTHPGGPGTDGR